MLVCVFLCTFCTRDRGCSVHPVFPAPSEWRVRNFLASLGHIRPRDRGLTPCRHCEEHLRRRFHGEWIAPRSEARLRLLKPLNLETTMLLDHPSDGMTAIRPHIGAFFV